MSTKSKPAVYVVDDEADFVDALCLLLKSASVGHRAFTSPQAFLDTIQPDQPGCILLDVRMPKLSGLQVQDELLRRGCLQPVIFLTGHGDIPMAVRATRAGAFDFLEKPVQDHVLLAAIKAATRQDRDRRRTHAARDRQAQQVAALTPRERQVAALLLEGLSSTAMAARLRLSVRTVEMHRLRMMRRLGVRNTAQAVKVLQSGSDLRN